MQIKGSIKEKDLRPFLEVLILKDVKDCNYLYAIRQSIHKKFGVKFQFSTLNGVLRRMEETRGLLTSELVKNSVTYKPPRRVYNITKEGKSTLAGLLDVITQI